MKYLPWKLLDTLTSPLDMSHMNQYDFCVLLSILSIGYYKVNRDINDDQTKFQYQSQVGITVFRSLDENRIELYNHITKIIITSSD